MQVQSNLGPAGIGGTNAAASAPAPEAAPPPPPSDETSPPPPRNAADKAVVVAREDAPPQPLKPERQKEVLPRARLNYDVEREEVYVEVLDRSTGEVLFTFPAKESDSARQSGLGQGSLVNQLA